MEQYGVSRTVIREALSRLQAAGLAETYRGKGTFVLTLPADGAFTIDSGRIRSVEDRLELLDFRLGVEVEAAALAARRRTDVQLHAMAAALADFRACRDSPSGALDADYRFHRAVAAAAANQFYVDLLASLGPTMITMPQNRLGGQDESRFERVNFEHEAIQDAVARGDSQGASAAMRTHLSNSRSRLERQRP
jgi:GntR family transcriptional repressor for pyruvate dehydrogenase complex